MTKRPKWNSVGEVALPRACVQRNDRRVDKASRTFVCQAGCVLEVLDSRLAEDQLMMPLDLGAKGR